MGAASSNVWHQGERELELLGLRVEDAFLTPHGSLCWADVDRDILLPCELPSILGLATTETTAAATGEARLQSANSYVLPGGDRLVVVVENHEADTRIEVWVAPDARHANLLVHETVGSWLRIGWKVFDSYAPCLGDDAIAVRAYRVLVDEVTGNRYLVDTSAVSPIAAADEEPDVPEGLDEAA